MSAGEVELHFRGELPDGTAVLVQVWGEDDVGPDGETGWTSELALRPEGTQTWRPPITLRKVP